MTTYLGMEQGAVVDVEDVVVTMPAAAQNGDTVFVFFWRSGGRANFGTQWSHPSNWTLWANSVFGAKNASVRTFTSSPAATYTWTTSGTPANLVIWRALAYRDWRGDVGSFSVDTGAWDNGLVVGSSSGDYKDFGETGWFTSANASMNGGPTVEFRRDYIGSAIDLLSSATSMPAPATHDNVGLMTKRVETAFHFLPSQSVSGNYETYTFSTWDNLFHDMEHYPRYVYYTSNTTLSESTDLGHWDLQPSSTASLKSGIDHWSWAEPTGDTWR